MPCTTSKSSCLFTLGQHCGVVLSDRISTVAMSRSGQLGLRCTVESNCSGMPVRLAGASVTYDRGLDTCEFSYVPEADRTFFIRMVHRLLGSWGT
jgi:hypothetical protein